VNTLRGIRIGLIGGGTMGQALLGGLLTQGVLRRSLCVSDPDPAIRRRLRRQFRLDAINDNAALVRAADVVILAVKPQQVGEVIAQIAPKLSSRQLVISIAAGIPLRWLQARLPGAAVIRVMPNLPATVGYGFAAIALGKKATARHRAITLAIFGAVGQVAELPERQLDAITAVSGSGPAYVFFLVQAWEAAAASLKLPPAVAARAIRQTLEGSVRLLDAAEVPAEALIRRVASKGGTTEAALKVLAKRRVATSIEEAIRAAARRSKELSWS